MYLEGVFYTSDFVVHGYLESTLDRLSDFLNLKNDTTVVLYDVRVSRLLNLSKSPAMSIPEVRLEKSSILFAVPIEAEKNQLSFYRRANRLIYRVKVFLPGFLLAGSIHLVEKFEARRVLLGRTEDFVPLTDVSATYLLNPAAPISTNIVIFNKTRMTMIGEDVEPGAAPGNPIQEPKKP